MEWFHEVIPVSFLPLTGPPALTLTPPGPPTTALSTLPLSRLIFQEKVVTATEESVS